MALPLLSAIREDMVVEQFLVGDLPGLAAPNGEIGQHYVRIFSTLRSAMGPGLFDFVWRRVGQIVGADISGEPRQIEDARSSAARPLVDMVVTDVSKLSSEIIARAMSTLTAEDVFAIVFATGLFEGAHRFALISGAVTPGPRNERAWEQVEALCIFDRGPRPRIPFDEASLKAFGDRPDPFGHYLPPVRAAFFAFYVPLMRDLKLDVVSRELIRLKMVRDIECKSCGNARLISGVQAGLTEEKIDRLDDPSSSIFTSRERLLLRYAEGFQRDWRAASGLRSSIAGEFGREGLDEVDLLLMGSIAGAKHFVGLALYVDDGQVKIYDKNPFVERAEQGRL